MREPPLFRVADVEPPRSVATISERPRRLAYLAHPTRPGASPATSWRPWPWGTPGGGAGPARRYRSDLRDGLVLDQAAGEWWWLIERDGRGRSPSKRWRSCGVHQA